MTKSLHAEKLPYTTGTGSQAFLYHCQATVAGGVIMLSGWYLYPTCERSILIVDELILMQIGASVRC